MGALEEYNGPGSVAKVLEPTCSVFSPSRWKAHERKGVGWEAGNNKCRERRARSRNRLDANARFNRCLDQLVARVRNERRSSIRYESDVVAAQQAVHERRSFCTLVVLVKARCWRRDRVAPQQPRGSSCIFSGDERGFTQHAESPGRNILEVADRRGDDVQRARHERRPFIVL